MESGKIYTPPARMSDNSDAGRLRPAAMESATLPHPDAVVDQVVAALRRDDVARAEQVVADHPDLIPATAFRRLAELNMRRRRWRDAAWLFDRIPDREPAADLKRCLARNLAALERHRPAVLAQLVSLPTTTDVAIAPSPTGRPTVICRRPDGGPISLSPGGDPLTAMNASVAKFRPALDKGVPVGLCGMGDGYVLHALSRDRTPLFLSTQQPVFVLEPDPQVALHCLMIHDYTGPDGPIEQGRFWWFVGAEWGDELERAALADPFVGCPLMVLGQSLQTAAIQARLKTIVGKVTDDDLAARDRVEEYYDWLWRSELATLFGPNPPRRPRVLLLTTRFSTVLQYSTRDTAGAFEQLGWDARVLIEPTPAHRMYQTAIRRALDEFRPDLLFQIDHLRYEHGRTFPLGLPFACWIQDHLPHLQTELSGMSVGGRDFVLTDAATFYVNRFDYPARQCIPLAKCSADAGEAGDDVDPAGAEDVVFVSNASKTAEGLLAGLGGTFAGGAREIVEAAARDLLDVYAAGGSVPSYIDVCDLFRRTLSRLGATATEADFLNATRWLMHPFNDALYRQQALGWACETAGRLGLSVGLYGRGWEDNPRFAPYARGPIEYGEPLRRLTRAARINLQIVPYFSLHQRLLDGLLAGGFFLVRRHPADTAPAALLDFLEAHETPGVATDADARRTVPAARRGELERHLADCRCLSSGTDDLVNMVRSWQASGQLVAGAEALPQLAEVSFADAGSLERLMDRFAADAKTRRDVVAQQRRSVADRFTYTAAMRRVVGEIAKRLAEDDDGVPVAVRRWA